MAVDTLKKGAINFIEKPFREQTLWDNIKKALALSAETFRLKAQQKEFDRKFSMLSNKEKQALKFLLDGDTDKQAALKLGVTRRAVAFHRTNILEKMETNTILELANTIAKLDVPI